jgi:hypothetical protein
MNQTFDRKLTLKNRLKLLENINLMYWYRNLFKIQLTDLNMNEAKVLEIGSGTSPINYLYPNVVTSDILNLEYIDHIFDCHNIESFRDIEDGSLDAIIMTNVLHHLRKPILFINRAASKLKYNGIICATEPYLSFVSKILYKYIHHEKLDLKITAPELNDVSGPLSSSNIALPYLMFFRQKAWLSDLKEKYTIDISSYYTFSSYFISGGISKKIAIPHQIYKRIFKIDSYLANIMPNIFASFFIVKLSRK